MCKVFIIFILTSFHAFGCQYCDEQAAIRNALADAFEGAQSTISETPTTQSGLVPRVTRVRGSSRFGVPCEKFRKKLEEELKLKEQKRSETFRSFSDFLKR